MRYLTRKRLKNSAPLEVTERRQVGDAEAIFNRTPSDAAAADQHHYPARGRDSEL